MRASTILFLIVLVALAAVAVLAGFQIQTLMAKKAAEAAKTVDIRIPVHVIQVEEGAVEDVVFITGYLDPAQRVDVLAKLPTPGKLIKAYVKKGDVVTKGQKIATVDRDLVGPSFSDIGPYYKDYVIEAPSSGIVVSVIDSPGAMISAQMPAAVIVNLDQVKVKTSIIEADLGRVKEGTPARVKVDAYPDRVFDAEISRIETVLDSYSHTISIEITIDNPDQALKPGMFARIELVSDVHQNVPVLPKHAVFQRQGKDLVYVVNQKMMRLELVEIKLGYYDLKNYEVLEGVSLKDLVVDQDQVVLKHLTSVSIKNPPEGWEPPEPEKIQSHRPPASPGGGGANNAVEPDAAHALPGATPAP